VLGDRGASGGHVHDRSPDPAETSSGVRFHQYVRSMTAEYYQVVTTTDAQDEADELARGIVAKRLGACVHLIPMTSVYRWNGEITRDEELRLVIKTTADRLDALIGYIKANHSYEVPQVVATEIVAGSADYLAWVREETRL
jgi:periplasmic divalent cation tolerance protein